MLAGKNGEAVGDFHVFRPSKIVGRYLQYLMLTEEYISIVDGSTYGAKMPRASWDFMADMKLPRPSTSEQEQIANFLDHETAKIDTLIDKQQQLIKLLKEKRQAVISHAVTKGLNPDVPMKDSGVEWLGEVPEDWSLPKLFQISSKIGDGLHSTPIYQEGTGYFFVNGNNLIDGSIVLTDSAKEVPLEEFQKHKVPLNESTVLVSINGTIGNLAMYEGERVILGKSAAYINCHDNLKREYLFFYLQSDQASHYYDIEVTGTTIYNLSLNSIRKMKACAPDVQEQKLLIDYCIKVGQRHLEFVSKAQQAIKLLQERRTALISAAITGKIDVRNWELEQCRKTEL